MPHPMIIGAIVRKSLFYLTGRPVLSDRVRNAAYVWAWSNCRQLGPGVHSVCDVGSRDSLLPSFLTWRGFRVTTVDPDARFTHCQESAARNWGVRLEVLACGITSVPADRKFGAVLCLFSLQHARDDAAAYGHIVSLLEPGGLVLTVNEYRHAGTKWERGRDDGDMRIYGSEDFAARVEQPLAEGGVAIIEKKFGRFGKGRQNLLPATNAEIANVVFLAGKKQG
jgi:SAM-dependent methyltransferase